MAFSNPVFTNAGKELYLRANAGITITFTTIAVGEGETAAEDIPALAALKSPVKSMSISGKMQGTDHFTVTGSFRNDEISHSFFWREFGVFAADPDYPDDRTKDILVLYQSSDENPEYISISSGEISEKTVRVNIFVGERTVIAAVDSTIFVSMAELEEQLANYTKTEQFEELSTLVSELSASKANTADVETALAGKSDTGHTHTTSQISGLPASLPASGGNADTATKAAQDSTGQQINTTYIKGLSVNGKTITYTKGDGTTGAITTQDTTYSNMKAASTSAAGGSGLVPAPAAGAANRYLRSDGTWQVPPDTNTTYSAASATAAGLVSTGAQTLAGDKTFNGKILPAGATDYGTPQARKLASGTADVTTANCPSGAWYGQHS